jgi:Ni/Co efflux regulator RcnB
MRLLIMLLMVAGFLAGSLPVAFDAEAAGSKSKDEVAGSDKDKKAEKARDEDALGDTLQTGRPVFSSVEKELIRDFFGGLEPDASGDLPYGLAKRDELPPGLQKHIEKYGTLPPGLAKRSLPYDLESRLPRLGSDLERVIVDDDVVLVQRATGVIFDILEDVLTQ